MGRLITAEAVEIEFEKQNMMHVSGASTLE